MGAVTNIGNYEASGVVKIILASIVFELLVVFGYNRRNNLVLDLNRTALYTYIHKI